MPYIIKKILKSVLFIFFWLLKYFVSKSNIILMQTYSPKVYCDNTKYLFEYLSKNTNYDIYWITESKTIINYLKENNLKYLDIGKKRNYLYSLYLILKPSLSFFKRYQTNIQKYK